MRESGLVRITVRPAFGFEVGAPEPRLLEYARGMAANAAGEGVATEAEAAAWLRQLAAVVASGRWFSADVMFVVAGTVPVSGRQLQAASIKLQVDARTQNPRP
jgi:hypothetical protein